VTGIRTSGQNLKTRSSRRLKHPLFYALQTGAFSGCGARPQKAAAGGLGAAEQGVREAHFRKVRRILGFFCKSEGIARIAYKGGLQQGQGMHGTSRASGLLTQRMRGRPNSISSDILIAHISGSMAGALADSEAAVNSPTLARPKRCKNSLVVAKRSRPCTTTQPKQQQKNNERSPSSGFRLRANAPEGQSQFPISPVRGGKP
jgi:hypothetical protein